MNDYHIVLTFGKHVGKRLMDVEDSYLDWVVKNVSNQPDVTDAIKRIASRKGVTALVKRVPTPPWTPVLSETSSKHGSSPARITPVVRPPDVNPSLYGSFIEYLIKHHLCLSLNDQPQDLLAMHGLAQVRSHLVYNGETLRPDTRVKWILKSFLSTERTISDVCNLSFAHSMLLGSFKEEDAAELFRFVRGNESYYKHYLSELRLPAPEPHLQKTCDQLSIGCVIGVIDLIAGDSIVDIKCCQTDDLDSWRKQLFAYACLHYLRYGPVIRHCEVWNFLTGKCYTMTLGDACERHAKDFVCMLGSYSPEHVKLLGGPPQRRDTAPRNSSVCDQQ